MRGHRTFVIDLTLTKAGMSEFTCANPANDRYVRRPLLPLPRASWIDQLDATGSVDPTIDRPGSARVRGRRHGEAEEPGQGVQPQPRNRLAPQRDRLRPGGAIGRGEPTGEQAAQAAVSPMGGEAPPAKRSAATPGRPARSAGRTRRGRGPGCWRRLKFDPLPRIVPTEN
jgi:hypothetical protein